MKSDVKLYHIIILTDSRETKKKKPHKPEWGDKNIVFTEANNEIKFNSLKRLLKSISTRRVGSRKLNLFQIQNPMPHK